MGNRAAKIICTYYGKRRNDFNTPSDIPAFLDISIENEINIENGIETDIIIINNNCGIAENDTYNLRYHDIKTKNGNILLEFRENIGGSFGAYYEMFLKYKNEYDYWFFCEDDVLIYKSGYMKDFIDIIDSDETIGFVSLAPISERNSKKIHSGGGIGLTSKAKFESVHPPSFIKSILDDMKHDSAYVELQKLEENFTSNFVKAGYKLTNHPLYSSLCDNYDKHPTQPGFISEDNLKKEFIYKVGI